jgi:hypothetical protein
VERSTAGLDVAALTQEVQILQLVPVEVAGDVDTLRPHNNHLKMEFCIYRFNHQTKLMQFISSVSDPDPYWIRIGSVFNRTIGSGSGSVI